MLCSTLMCSSKVTVLLSKLVSLKPRRQNNTTHTHTQTRARTHTHTHTHTHSINSAPISLEEWRNALCVTTWHRFLWPEWRWLTEKKPQEETGSQENGQTKRQRWDLLKMATYCLHRVCRRGITLDLVAQHKAVGMTRTNKRVLTQIRRSANKWVLSHWVPEWVCSLTWSRPIKQQEETLLLHSRTCHD